jgi:hypothetical protein
MDLFKNLLTIHGFHLNLFFIVSSMSFVIFPFLPIVCTIGVMNMDEASAIKSLIVATPFEWLLLMSSFQLYHHNDFLSCQHCLKL